jgi:hypothetical protein
MSDPRRIHLFISAMMLTAAGAAGYAGFASNALHPAYALAVLALAATTSRLRVKLPGLDGNMSVNLPFLLIAVVNLSAAEAIAITCISTAVQCWPRSQAKLNPQQMAFNISMMSFATCLASFFSHLVPSHGTQSATLGLILAGAALFVGQTAPVAGVISISEGREVAQIWRSLAQLSFPYYILGTGVSSMVQMVSSHSSWPVALAVFPVMYGVHRSYQLYFSRLAEMPRQTVLVRAAAAGT